MTEQQIDRIMAVACDEICRWPYEARNKDHFGEICDQCPLRAELIDMEEAE